MCQGEGRRGGERVSFASNKATEAACGCVRRRKCAHILSMVYEQNRTVVGLRQDLQIPAALAPSDDDGLKRREREAWHDPRRSGGGRERRC